MLYLWTQQFRAAHGSCCFATEMRQATEFVFFCVYILDKLQTNAFI